MTTSYHQSRKQAYTVSLGKLLSIKLEYTVIYYILLLFGSLLLYSNHLHPIVFDLLLLLFMLLLFVFLVLNHLFLFLLVLILSSLLLFLVSHYRCISLFHLWSVCLCFCFCCCCIPIDLIHNKIVLSLSPSSCQSLFPYC